MSFLGSHNIAQPLLKHNTPVNEQEQNSSQSEHSLNRKQVNNKSLSQIEDTLAPVEKGIVGITDPVNELRPLLDALKKDIETGTGLANDAQDQGNAAQDEADQAAKVHSDNIQ